MEMMECYITNGLMNNTFDWKYCREYDEERRNRFISDVSGLSNWRKSGNTMNDILRESLKDNKKNTDVTMVKKEEKKRNS